ncbi:MAG: hypothetical protein IJW40_09725 [Clostridia bacterium]|nr:hypothetical protein [Clostridia bacterium]
MKKIFYLFLALLLCATVLVACTPADGDKPDIPEGERMVLLQDGAATFQVIRSDLITSTDPATKSAIRVVSSIKELTGMEPSIYTDYTGKGGYAEMEYEILIGETTRPESATAYEIMGDQDYAICVVDTKLCIVGRNARCLDFAIDEFFADHLYFEDGIMYVSNQLSIKDVYRLPEGIYFEVAGPKGKGSAKFDESVALACLQGIMNRESPNKVYVNSGTETAGWLEVFREEGRWLADAEFLQLEGFDDLLEFGEKYVKTVVIWDESVDATLNVACTIAGVEDGIVMSETMYKSYKDILSDKKIVSLVDQFDGSVTGSAKNDAYRWAIENYLAKGLCSTEYICSYIDGWSFRDAGNISYTVVRDWGIYHRAFVYDLSPWSDEAPLDDPDQKLGTDKETLMMIFETMLELTADIGPYEVCGFFEHQKYSESGQNSESKHGSVATEWEYASLMTPYNGFHNTCIDNAWNESFHGLYDGAQQLTNNRPTEEITLESDVVYLCFFMGDYDSTHPVYRYLKQAWDDPRRGEIPFAWAVNPNLLDTYPDMIEYYYETATPNDYFVSDASAAGYFMPSQVPDELWPNMLEHNIEYFNRADMTIAPMVLDRKGIDSGDLDMLVQFAPDGIATVLQAKVYMHDDTPVAALLGSGYDRYDSAVGAENLAKVVEKQFTTSNSGASLNLLRCVWTTPTVICETVDLYREANPDKEVVVVDIYNYFKLIEQDLNWK